MEGAGQNKMSLETILNDDDERLSRPRQQQASPYAQKEEPSQVILPYRPSAVKKADLQSRPLLDMREDSSHWQRVARPVHTSRDEDVRGPRPPRFRYTEEESLFCWYHRVDLGMRWDRVAEEFWRRWPHLDRKKSGLQCKFYRLLDDFGVEKVREQNRHGQNHGEGGVTYTTKVRLIDRVATRYPWMTREHYNQPPLARYAGRAR